MLPFSMRATRVSAPAGLITRMLDIEGSCLLAELRRGSRTWVGLGSAPDAVARNAVRGQPPRGAAAMVNEGRSRVLPCALGPRTLRARRSARIRIAPSDGCPHAVSREVKTTKNIKTF